jgi:hypothetical protein
MTKPKEKGTKKAQGFQPGNKLGSKIKPGEVRNPKGRRDAMSDIIRQILDEDDGKVKKELSKKLIDHARVQDGDAFLKALDRILDRTEGKPMQTQVNIEGDAKPIKIIDVD